MVDHPRSTLTQMRACLYTLAMIGACDRLHGAKAITKKSEADLLGRQLKDARDFLAALEPHAGAIKALLSGERLVPASMAVHAAQQMAEEGTE